ncbi:MAG: ATP-dependent DNA helicase [Actinomycetaceae bacterium]|nr:ATP-dependent DNA helicase [Actinomycetaceae bacterium]
MAGSEDLLDAVVEGIGGSRRDGQVAMAAAVDEALEGDGHLLVQAGTGTGKSLGYLVPAMKWAVEQEARVTISTATLALQRQIVAQDAPRVAQTVYEHTGRRPQVALLKGWNNYVCLRKAAGGYPEEDSLFSRAEAEYGASATGEEVVRLREWAMSTDTGDRDDLTPGVSDRAWAQVSISKPDCIGQKCPVRGSCFPILARHAAEEADIVVTNHAMLGVQAARTPVLPESQAIVIDEAHELVDRVTEQLTISISKFDVAALARILRRESIVSAGLEKAGDALDAALDAQGEGRLTDLPDDLADALLGLLGELQQAGADVDDLSGRDEAAAAAKNVARNRVATLADGVEQLLSGAVGEGKIVLWVARDREDRSSLRAAPLDVSTSLADTLFESRPVVLTSATLQVGGSFEYAANRVGFDFPSQGPWKGIDVGSPFDHARQGIVYVAADLPAPGRDGIGERQLEEIRELIEASGGGALALFTSHRAVQAAAEYVRDRIATPVLCQGDDQLPSLVEAFAADDAASLFGTISLWQGVDVPGRTCRLVIIDRIPFPRPNDPLVQARNQAVAEAGGNAFMRVSASHAALLLAQGAGRLLRRVTDRGVVAILDPRLRTARYGPFLTSSLPPMWPTTDGRLVRAALARLAAAP